jgi:hypothetical protein
MMEAPLVPKRVALRDDLDLLSLFYTRDTFLLWITDGDYTFWMLKGFVYASI